MAAPASKNIRDLNGTWTMNKTLSDDSQAILALQGVGWVIRKAIGMITVTLIIKTYTDEQGVYHIDIEQPGAAGVKGTNELRTVDGAFTEHEDHVFGAVKGQTTFKKFADFDDNNKDDKFFKSNWSPDTVAGDELIYSQADSVKNGWTARQVWGFEDINGERRHCRHVIVTKKDQQINARLVYDFIKEN